MFGVKSQMFAQPLQVVIRRTLNNHCTKATSILYTQFFSLTADGNKNNKNPRHLEKEKEKEKNNTKFSFLFICRKLHREMIGLI